LLSARRQVQGIEVLCPSLPTQHIVCRLRQAQAWGAKWVKSEGRQNGFDLEAKYPCRQNNCLTAAISLRSLCHFDASNVHLIGPDPKCWHCSSCILWSNTRRWSSGERCLSAQHSRCALHGITHPGINTAAADVGYRGIDIGIGRARISFQQRCSRYDHPWRAKPALHGTCRHKCLLHRMAPINRQLFNRRDKAPFRFGKRHHARPQRLAINIDHARAAIALPAAKLCPCQVGRIAQRPKQRRLRVHIILDGAVIHSQLGHTGCRYAERKA
jgi:hypothetical protein